ncbi:MAG: c-type cytochrome [Thermanaerothrix sp.]|nr:c-type cytochrome [Thermanaerothrix sp.]
MRKPGVGWAIVLIVIAGLVVGHQVGAVKAQTPAPTDDVVLGARLYDDWTEVKGVTPPPGSHPIWARQSTNTLSGAETWRCVTCHGWDYQGKDGAWGSGANYTGFPGVYSARSQPAAALTRILSGSPDPEHDFSTYLSAAEIQALVAFLREGVVDDRDYIDLVSRKVIGGDVAHGQALYTQTCAACHGEDGQKITFRYQGMQVSLASLAVQDPWRFLHRTRFGVARAPEMPIGATLGWSAQDGRDVLAYAQTLPSGLEPQVTPPLAGREPTPAAQPGGPAQNLFTAILTALGAMAASLGFALLLGALLVGILLVVVWLLRSRR